MVVGAFPVVKLGILLVRQVSKPLVGYVKEGAKRSHVFRNWICLPVAQFYHRCEIRYKLWIQGLGKPTQVTPLNEAVAIDLGADILGEMIVFVIAGGLLTAEYVRSAAKARAKEEEEEQRFANLENKLVELDLLVEQQRAQLREFERNLHSSPFRGLTQKIIPSSRRPPPSSGAGTSAPPGSSSSSSSAESESKTSDGIGDGANVASTSGTVSSQRAAGGAGVVAIRTSKSDDAHTSKVIRRAVKILLNTYEEAFED